MATLTKVYQFSEDLSNGVHNLGSDTLTVALTAAANAPTTGSTVIGSETQISYTYCSSRVITTTSNTQTTGTCKLVLADLVLTASGGSVGPFRYVIIYNDTPTSPLDPIIGFYDYGSEITLADGDTLTIDFDQTNGMLTVA